MKGGCTIFNASYMDTCAFMQRFGCTYVAYLTQPISAGSHFTGIIHSACACKLTETRREKNQEKELQASVLI